MGGKINPHIIRCLAVLNENRGVESTGFFNSKGQFIKNNDKATTYIRNHEVADWIVSSAKNCWAICGHCRACTRGVATAQNAHPFQFGAKGQEVVGAHNGHITNAPITYPVDSMFAFDELSKHPPGDYKNALGEMAGWYVLTWMDARDKSLYFLNWEGSLSFCKYDGVVYYSSDINHLQTALGKVKCVTTRSGEVWSFNGARFRQMAQFKGKKKFEQPPHQTGIHGSIGCSDRPKVEFTGMIQKWPDNGGRWWGETKRKDSQGHSLFVELANQEYFNRMFPDTRYGKCEWPANKRMLAVKGNDSFFSNDDDTVVLPNDQTGVVKKITTEEEVEAESRMLSGKKKKQIDDIIAAIQQFKEDYGGPEVKLGSDFAREKAIENFQEDALQELTNRGYSHAEGVSVLRKEGLLALR